MSIAGKVESFNSLLEEVKEFDFEELSLDNLGTWPDFVKVAIFIGTFLLVMGAGYYFIVSDLIATNDRVESKEIQLKNTFSRKAFMAANLSAYREQMIEMQESFGALVSQLPTDTEVPGLLEDITTKGEVSGLEIKSIDLDSEISKEFYVQLPIDIVVSGSYHDMGAFVSGVASLPRIVTLTDFTISPAHKGAGKRGNTALQMDIKAYTYRYKESTDTSKRRSRG